MGWKNFSVEYLRSMRLYYCFVTGATTLVGVIAAHAGQPHAWGWRDAVVLTVGFFAWGVNQIFNDAGNLPEDRINAPERPIASGRLPLRGAVTLSAGLMFLFAVASLTLSWWTLAPILVGVGFNLLYSRLKGVPGLGCLVYGVSISMCAAYGWIGSYGGLPPGRAAFCPPVLCLLVLPAHVLMCHNSYFKDIPGDRAAGKRTLQVRLPYRCCLWISGIVGGSCSLLIFLFVVLGGNHWGALIYFLFLLVLNGALLQQLARRHFPAATLWNAVLCVVLVLGIAIACSGRWLIAVGAAPLLMMPFARWGEK